MRWIEWALTVNLPTSEKLVALYLAIRANHAGVGRWDREELARVTGFERRSIQRLLKALRDAGHLSGEGEWYALAAPGEAGAEKSPSVDLGSLPAPAPDGGLPIAPAVFPSQAELEAAGETISQRLVDGAEYLMDQLNNFEARLAQTLTRALAAMPTGPAAPEPPPDPVKSSPIYQQLLEILPEEEAYAAAQRRLDATKGASDATEGAIYATDRPIRETTARATSLDVRDHGAVPDASAGAYLDNSEGRFMRVWDILHGKPPTPEALQELLGAWRHLETEENRFTVRGETDAFELLYPAIVAAARAKRATVTMREFLDPKAIAEGRAPWDEDPDPAPTPSDAVLQADINRMVGELQASNDPRCAVLPRTVEKGEDGVTRTESVQAYHRRVAAKHRQMVKLKQMGVLSG